MTHSHFCFFFFKQKTAYEMRISDWSSDVCSSDLQRDRHRECPAADRRAGPRHRGAVLRGTGLGRPALAGQLRLHRGAPERLGPARREAAGEDRKSVVEGKSVSVRVDLGGRRIIKTKNTVTRSIHRSRDITQ